MLGYRLADRAAQAPVMVLSSFEEQWLRVRSNDAPMFFFSQKDARIGASVKKILGANGNDRNEFAS
jgi:hypothetical protein